MKTQNKDQLLIQSINQTRVRLYYLTFNVTAIYYELNYSVVKSQRLPLENTFFIQISRAERQKSLNVFLGAIRRILIFKG